MKFRPDLIMKELEKRSFWYETGDEAVTKAVLLDDVREVLEP